MKSSRFQIQAIQKQFPGLFRWPESSADGKVYAERARPLIREDRVESIRVAIATPALMAERPTRRTTSGNLCGVDDDRAFFLLGSDMSVLAEVKQDGEYWTPSSTSHQAGETVGEAVAALEDPAAVAFILERHIGFEVDHHHSVGGYDAVLYKAPRAWTIPDWVAEQQRRAAESLSEQVIAIDDDGADPVDPVDSDGSLSEAACRRIRRKEDHALRWAA